MIEFLIDDLDARLKLLRSSLATRSDFTALRDQAFKMAMAKYQAGLRIDLDPWATLETMSGTAPSTGTAVLDNATIGDLYQITLLTGAERVAGDVIWVEQDAGVFKACPRLSLEEIILGGADEVTLAFFETKGIINLYAKQALFTAPAEVHYLYFRTLDTDTTPTTNPIDIKSDDFSDFCDSVLEFIPED